MFGMDKLTWPAAFVIVAILGTIVGLVSLGQDLTAVGVAIAGILGFLGIQNATTKEQVTEVKTQTNGNNQKLVEALLRDRDYDRAILRQVLIALPPGTEIKEPAATPFPAQQPIDVEAEPTE